MGANTDYEFVNSQTGNVIEYLSLSDALGKDELAAKLEKKKVLLATSHKLSPHLIYWQDKNHPI